MPDTDNYDAPAHSSLADRIVGAPSGHLDESDVADAYDALEEMDTRFAELFARCAEAARDGRRLALQHRRGAGSVDGVDAAEVLQVVAEILHRPGPFDLDRPGGA